MLSVETALEESVISGQLFIGGCSRSGTTLLGAMLGKHPDVVTTPESHFKYRVYRNLGGEIDEHNIRQALDAVIKHWRFKIWELDVDRSDILARLPRPTYAELLCRVVELYASRVGRSQARLWVDHTPENTTYGMTLLEIFPGAKFLHIVRDGRGVASSIMPLDWGPNTIIRTAHWWVESVAYGLALERVLSPERITRIQYEKLVREPEDTMKAVCDFIGIGYDPSMLESTGFRVPRYTASQHELIGQKPDTDRVTRWQRALTGRQVELFEHESRDFLAYLGYPLLYPRNRRGPSIGELVADTLGEAWRSGFFNNFRWLRRAAPLWYRRHG
jgi:hypothetical protein